jgi:hypothetical protein
MTRHLQKPYRIWPLADLEEDQIETTSSKFSSFNLQCPLSISSCNNPLREKIRMFEQLGVKSRDTPTTTNTEAPSNPARSAIEDVLNTTELLELILCHTLPVTLYKMRYTCSRWKALIETSPTLRKVLFLDSKRPAINPQRSYSHATSTTLFTLNPILSSLKVLSASSVRISISHTEWDVHNHKHIFCTIHFPPRWRIRGAFWREMQIADPPIKRVFLRSSWLEKYIEREGGITAGVLADLLEFQTGRLYFFHS